MKVSYEPMPREDVLTYLGPHWPPKPGTTVMRVLSLASVTDGALTVHQAEDHPGTTWWVVDGLIVPQDAGPPLLLPGDRLETIPDPPADSPPLELTP